MTTQNSLPVLVTFDGQARSGKGTIVHAVKRSLQANDIKTMLIDAGQVFRVLVVSAAQHNVDIDDPIAIDAFLSDASMLEETAALVKKVYDMDHDERDALLYTTEVGANSAKFGARPKAQDFKDSLLKKWYKDAGDEGYEVILHDGRALEETGLMLEDAGLCDYRIGFYFECDPIVGARRMLGYADRPYGSLTGTDKESVDTLVEQIIERNRADAERAVQPIVPPAGAQRYVLPVFDPQPISGRQMFIVDTSADMTKEAMTEQIVKFFEGAFHVQAAR
jgi:cytidylate kinase